ncbi:MAG: hypothetical protein EXQ48_01495 [Acidobacteria bacterium]|nr:hypothetical protein [Acidobacteriota bacterium]
MTGVPGLRRPNVIETDPSSSFVCDYVAGVNRVLSLPPYLLVDNIGRNVEIWRFDPGEREPAARARYDLTSYPGDPMASLLDVDIHAAFLRRDGHELLAVNHFGRVRGFELPVQGSRMRPAWELQLLGDTERIVMAGECFIASSPRGEFTDDPSQPGVLLFEPIARSLRPTSGDARRLAWDQALSSWGVVSALAVSADANALAVASGPRLGVFGLAHSSDGLRLGDCIWEAPLRFHCQWLRFGESERLWAGGYQPLAGAERGDWDDCRGGGIDAFAVDSGARHFTAALPGATAWGYGADPLVLGPGGREVYVLGRDGSLHVIDMASRASHQLSTALELADGAEASLGIGHATLRDGWLYAGFNRGGFRLLRYDLRPATS